MFFFSNKCLHITYIFTWFVLKKKECGGLLLTSELGFVFNQIDSISASALIHNSSSKSKDTSSPFVGCFVPRNFLTTFATLPEASALALVDGAPASVETARRCEAFYRFMSHHLDKELSLLSNSNNNKWRKINNKKLIEDFQGIDFISMNEFINSSGSPTISSNRSYTVDLCYEPFLPSLSSCSPDKKSFHYFSEILQYSLCKDSRLRAWCDATKSYETVVQRKIATSLPSMMTLTCSCAGTKSNEGLAIWTQQHSDPCWLPEFIQVEIEDSNNIIVRQCIKNDGQNNASANTSWKSFEGKGLPKTVSDIIKNQQKIPSNTVNQSIRKRSYQLEAVVSYVKTENTKSTNENDEVSNLQQHGGHHIVHVRVPKGYSQVALSRQIEEIKKCLHQNNSTTLSESKMSTNSDKSLFSCAISSPWTLTAQVSTEIYESRLEATEKKLNEEKIQNNPSDDWILLNGISVSSANVDEACNFQNPGLREPCIVIYRQINNLAINNVVPSISAIANLRWPTIKFNVMKSLSIIDASLSPHTVSGPEGRFN